MVLLRYMASLDELRNVRINKLQKLQDFGMNPYPTSVPRDYSCLEVIQNFNSFEQEQKIISIVGRVLSIRGQGAIMFVSLFDGTEKFQVVFKKDAIASELFSLFAETVDLGDFIAVSGKLFVTQKGAQSLLVENWQMATKSLLPIPSEYYGFEDAEEKMRKRYLDAIIDQDVFSRFVKRTEIVKYIRNFFDTKNFMEIETPILQNQAGGAMARTFNTHHNDYDMDMVLRISLELEHKMMMVAGYNRIYEIGKNFRNEGSDPTHIQEFTMIEWYAAFETLEKNMQWTEDLVKGIAQDIMQKTSFSTQDKDGNNVIIELDSEWQRVRFDDLLRKNADLDMTTASIDEIKSTAKKWGMSDEEIVKTGRGNLLDYIYKKSSRNYIIQPTFVTNYPSELKPLAQQNDDGTAQVVQLIIAGAEITNQYAELVNPVIQRELLEQQSSVKAGGDDEAMEIDERFLTAMEHGMPPMTGFGMGIDRLVALLTEQDNLRDVIFYPIMRPKE